MSRGRQAALLFLLALALRLIAPGVSPPGFGDDELSNALVISQHVRDGDIRLYYPDASGHEGLYHLLAAPLIPLFGPGHLGIRGLSILCGALSVALLYLLTRSLWDRPTALLAALGLAFSFWSLVYSRSGQRHISVTVSALLAFYCWWRGMDGQPEPAGAGLGPTPAEAQEKRSPLTWFAASGVALGLGFYTYFAARGVPLILLAFAGYLLLFHRQAFARRWRGFALALALAAALGAPLAVTLSQNPEAEARVDELAAPLHALRAGDPSMLLDSALSTLGMFHATGDDEALYNIPYRPVFGPVGAVFFFLGVGIAVWNWRKRSFAFLLLWFAAGLAPGAMAVPAASLGHTILAQPAAYVFPAVAVVKAAHWFSQPARRRLAGKALLVLALVYLGAEGVRGVVDYFVVRPRDGYVRVLFHTDFIELARYLDQHREISDIAVGAQIEERWNQVAFGIALERADVRARWYDPCAAQLALPDGSYAALPHYLFPPGTLDDAVYDDPLVRTGDFLVALTPAEAPMDSGGGEVPFAPGLTLVGSRQENVGEAARIWTTWRVDAPLELPPRPLYAKPAAPGEPDKPRLWVFLHVLPPGGDRPVLAESGLGADPYTLRPGDLLSVPLDVPLAELAAGQYWLGVGLFDVWTGARWPALDGRDVVIIGEFEVLRE